MATVTKRGTQEAAAAVLHGVSYREYARLTRLDANRHLRMAYYDGTLEIMSPGMHEHEQPSRRISTIITSVADVLNLPYNGTGSFTVRRQGDGPRKGTGREADQSFYFASVDRLPMDREPSLDAGDPPPDLWVEVDNRSSSRTRLPTYARLGIPEVWQYRVESKQIRFLRLENIQYLSLEQSLALPVLTPALVEEALRHGATMIESHWVRWLREWSAQFHPRVIE